MQDSMSIPPLNDSDYPEKQAFLLAEQGSLEIVELMNVAERLNVAGRKDRTISLYRLWLEHTESPLAYIAFFNLGVVLAACGDHQQAEVMYRKSLEQNSDLLQARLNLGNCLEQQKREDEALEQWRIVAESKNIGRPENRKFQLHALNNLGRLLEVKKQYKIALEMLEKSFAVDPTQRDVIIHLVHLTQKICKWPVYSPPKGVAKLDMIQYTSPLAMLAYSDDPALQLSSARCFLEHKYPVTNTDALAAKEGYKHDKIRIGYLSSDFCLHAVSLLTVELLELHDHSQFEIYGFSWSREDGTALRQRVITSMDHYIRIDGMSDKEAAECIRSHEIDIIIDLQGLTSGARPLILWHRPATVQMTYLGFPGTTALPWIDYVIADTYLIPKELVPFHTEKPLYMPHCFQSSDSKREVGKMPSRADNNLPEDAFVFCVFNNNYKFTPEMFAVWMRILKRTPGSVLWLLEDNEWARENLIRAAKKHGIKKERLVFATRVAPADYLARYQLADLFLDTFPFNGGTTANDALFMGLPLLTLSGRTFASRMAGSLLTYLKLPELITSTMKEYEDKAVWLAKKTAELSVLKSRLKENKVVGDVFNTNVFVKSFETELLRTLGNQPGARKDAQVQKSSISINQSCADNRKFLIAAPKYSHHSAGIHALYNLCDSLNKIGREAYIIHYEFFQDPNAKPSIKFRFSADPSDYPKNLMNIKIPLFAIGTEQIHDFISENYVVYPEVVSGNPLNAPRVVRYVLNSEVANGYPMGHGDNDFIVTFSDAYITNYHHKLFQLFYNPLFNDIDSVPHSERSLNLTYIGKGFKYGKCPIIANSVELTRNWPSEKNQLATLLRSTKYFYTWDSLTQTSADAILCGAVPVYLRFGPFSPDSLDKSELGPIPRIEGTLEGDNEVVLMQNDNYAEVRRDFIRNYHYVANSLDERVRETASKIDLFFCRGF